MNKLKKLYGILGRMISAAEAGDAKTVAALNAEFNVLIPDVQSSEEMLSYDNCRQSCMMAVQDIGMRKAFLEDAAKRFSKIKRPI